MSKSDTKVVQTELPRAEYERLRLVADEQGISLKEALRRAAGEYVDERDRFDPDDPFFSFHDRVDASSGRRTDAAEMDEDLYGDAG